MKNRLSEKLQKNPITRNSTPKLASLLFAILLWIYVMDVENPEMFKVIKNVDVAVIGAESLEASGLILLDGSIPGIDVTVKGRRTDVNNVDKSDIRLMIDVSGLKQGEQTVDVGRAMSLDNISITALSKRSLKVTLDKLSEELKPVEIAFKGESRPGFMAEAAIPDPPMILVRGPSTLVSRVVRLQGEVDSTSITAMTQAEIPIRAVDSAGKTVEGVALASKSVKANLSLFQLKALAVNPTLTGKVPDGFELVDVQLNPGTVSLKGPEEVLKDFTFLKTKAINLNTLIQTDTVNVELDLPEGITAPDLSGPLKALVRIEAVKSRELTYNADEVKFINAAPGTYGKMLGPLKIRIKGIESMIDALKKDDVTIKVDLAGQTPSRINANVIYDLPAKYSGLQIEPSRVEVDIVE